MTGNSNDNETPKPASVSDKELVQRANAVVDTLVGLKMGDAMTVCVNVMANMMPKCCLPHRMAFVQRVAQGLFDCSTDDDGAGETAKLEIADLTEERPPGTAVH